MSDLIPKDNFTIKQGSKRTWTWKLTDNNGDPFDFSNYSAKMEIRDKPGGTLYLSLTSTPAAGLTINALAGEIVPLITGAQAALFNFDKAEYDCFVTNGSGEPTCLVEGVVTLKKRITQ
jgi:hypothetical protein